MKGYTTQKWSAGDVIIVPAGVPHMIGYEVTVPNDILRVVFDPNKSIKAVPDREASMARLHAEGQQPQAQSPIARQIMRRLERFVINAASPKVQGGIRSARFTRFMREPSFGV